MKHVFISYAHTDRDMMEKVHQTLAQEFPVWTDEKLTPGTPSWLSAVQQAIDEAFAIVVLLSPNAKRSEWVSNEISYASMQGVTIIPLLVSGEARESVLFRLAETQYIDVRSNFVSAMRDLSKGLQIQYQDIFGANSSNETSKELTDKKKPFLEFWTALKQKSEVKMDLFANVKPTNYYFMATSAGRANVLLQYIIRDDFGAVELNIDLGDKAKNEAFFAALYAQKAAIEEEFNGTLEWFNPYNVRRCKIIKRFNDGGLAKPETWPALQDQMVDAMIRLNNVLRPRLDSISV